MLCFGDIIRRVATECQILGDMSAGAQANYSNSIIPRKVQEAYKVIWDEDNWGQLCGETYVAPIAANGYSFVLPKRYVAVLKAYNSPTGGPISIRDFVTFGDDAFTIVTNLNQTNDFTSMARMASQAVETQPATAQLLKVASSAAADVGVNVWIRGKDANYENQGEIVALGASQAGTGTVSTANGSATVTGIAGTSFNTQLQVGDSITIGGVTRTILAIAGAASLTTTANWDALNTAVAFTFADATAKVTTTKSYLTIETVSKTTIPTNGVITVYDNSSNALGTISMWEYSPEYNVYRLNGTTGVNVSIQCIVKLQFIPLMNNFDVPFMDMDDALFYGAVSKVWREHRQIELANKADKDFRDAMAGIKDTQFENDGAMYCLPFMRA